VRAVAAVDDELTAHVTVAVHLRPTTGLRVASFPRSTTGSPFVSLQIGDGAGQVRVMTHELADLDRLGDLIAQARQSLATMLTAGTAWERHDDPTVDMQEGGRSDGALRDSA